MSLKPKKHSLTLHGHRTSVSLEDRFWNAFCQIAKERQIPINVLAAKIDETRDHEQVGLATSIRDFVLSYYIEKSKMMK